MQRKSLSDMACSLARALDEVGEWWSLLIIQECTYGSMRFDEFQKRLGIARNVLTARLERLTALDIIERFPLPDKPGISGYRLTRKGEELYPVLVVLKQWGDKWLAPGGKPHISLVDEAYREAVEPVSIIAQSGERLSFRQIRFEPGPNASDATKALIIDRNEKILGQK
jgi:DNA-binding HxlR family transcriptional regulator